MFTGKHFVQVILPVMIALIMAAPLALAFDPIHSSSANSSYLLQVIDSVASPVNFAIVGSPFSSGSNGVRQNQSLTFDFYFYGVRYTQVGIGYNGNLQWGSIDGTDGIIPDVIPSSSISQTILAWFATDLNCVQDTCGGGVGVLGSVPNRVFIVRALNWTYQVTKRTGTGNVTVDILLYETSNVIEIRYYSVSALPSTSYSVTVGVQQTADNWLSVVSANNTVSVVNQFQGRTLRFVPVNNWSAPSPSPSRTPLVPVRSAGSRYYASVIESVPVRPSFEIIGSPFHSGHKGVRENIPIPFPFKFYGVSYNLLGVGYNGNVQWNTSDVPRVLLKSIPNLVLGIPLLGWFSDNLVCQSGVCGGGVGVIGDVGSRQFIIRVVNWGYQVTSDIGYGEIDLDIVLSESDSSIEIRYYTVSALPSEHYVLTVGAQNADGSKFVVFINGSSTVDATNALMGRTLKMKPF